MDTATVRALARRTLSLVFPRFCAVCGAPVAASSPWALCAACASAMREDRGRRCSACGKPLVSRAETCTRCQARPAAFDSAYPLYAYAGTVRDAVIAYKKVGRRSLAGFFAAALARALAERWPGRVVVPVPPRPGKLRSQGWDQVESIARLLESRHGVGVARLLARSGGRAQKELGLAARRENMKGRMSLAPGLAVPERPVLLDDVMTTGATLSECARVLKDAGAVRVDALTIAAD